MSGEHLHVAHAAICIPMTWLTQAKFPPKKAVLTSFKDAVSFLRGIELYDVAAVRIALEGIIAGTDPRGGTFAKQTIAAAAQLHDLNARMAVATLNATESIRQEAQ